MCEPSRKFLPGPLSHAPFKVDDFSKGASLYFLTHAHTDHLYGLSDNWRHGKLYCTQITKQLLLLKFPSLDAKLIRTLEIGQKKLIMLENSEFSLSVTVLDAQHCAGSSMYLFESKQIGRVLHTGDFRYEDNDKIPEELCEVEEGVTTCVYLDNTYGLQSSPQFPMRAKVTDTLAEALKRYPPSTRFIFSMQGLGKEELVLRIAMELDSGILVTESERLEQIRCFASNTSFTDGRDQLTDIKKIRVILTCRGAEDEALKTFGEENSVIISCSGWCGKPTYYVLAGIAEGKVPPNQLPRQLRVPYSLHSTRQEIVDFIKRCDFQYVIPIVNTSSKDRDELGLDNVKEWTQSMVKAWESPVRSPECIQKLKEINLSKLNIHKTSNRIIASPEGHKRRMEAKRMRFIRDRNFDGIEIMLRRDRETDFWSPEEERIVHFMMMMRREMDVEGHAELRKRLKRTDQEIMMKMDMIRREVMEDRIGRRRHHRIMDVGHHDLMMHSPHHFF